MEWEHERIYLAAPYSNFKDKDYIVNEVSSLAARLYQIDYLVYSPLTMTHYMCRSLGLPGDYGYWRPLDESIIKLWATQLWIATYEGWQYSKGCYLESILAYKEGKRRRLVDPLTLKLTNLNMYDFKV